MSIETESFDVCVCTLSCTITQGLQTMAIGFCLAMVLLINIVLVINYYEINKEL
jgi:hypothetical protein